jgi:hypothetical protein
MFRRGIESVCALSLYFRSIFLFYLIISFFYILHSFLSLINEKTAIVNVIKTKLRGSSPQANYTDRAIAAGQRS